jgi:hypothetical protein
MEINDSFPDHSSRVLGKQILHLVRRWENRQLIDINNSVRNDGEENVRREIQMRIILFFNFPFRNRKANFPTFFALLCDWNLSYTASLQQPRERQFRFEFSFIFQRRCRKFDLLLCDCEYEFFFLLLFCARKVLRIEFFGGVWGSEIRSNLHKNWSKYKIRDKRLALRMCFVCFSGWNWLLLILLFGLNYS